MSHQEYFVINAAMTLFEFSTGNRDLQSFPSITSSPDTFLRIMKTNTITFQDIYDAISNNAKQTLLELCILSTKWTRMTILRMHDEGITGCAYITAQKNSDLIPIITEFTSWSWRTLSYLPMEKIIFFTPYINRYMKRINSLNDRQLFIAAHHSSNFNQMINLLLQFKSTLKKSTVLFEIIVAIIEFSLSHDDDNTEVQLTEELFTVDDMDIRVQRSIYHIAKVYPNMVNMDLLSKLDDFGICDCNHPNVELMVDIGKFYDGEFPDFLLDYCIGLLEESIEEDDVESFKQLYTYCLGSLEILKTDDYYSIKEEILNTRPRKILVYCLKCQLFNPEDHRLVLEECFS